MTLSPELERQKHLSSLGDIVSSVQAPLPDAHPENLVQCVLWGKFSLVMRQPLSLLKTAVCPLDKFPLVKAELRKISSALKLGNAKGEVDLAAVDVTGYLPRTFTTTKENVIASPEFNFPTSSTDSASFAQRRALR